MLHSAVEGVRTNEFPIFDESPTFVKHGINASLYEAGPANARFPVVHVYGNAYEVGYAQGLMQKKYLREFISATYEYFVWLLKIYQAQFLLTFKLKLL